MTIPAPPSPAEGDGAALGAMVRRLRQDAGLTIEALAEAADISVRAIGNLERGRSRGPQLATIDAVAKALQVDDALRHSLISCARRGRRREYVTPVVSCTLPPPAADFAGRDADLIAVRTLLTGAVPASAATLISGMPGIGKTALAVYAAHQLAGNFTDGGLFYIDLRGLDFRPVTSAQAQERLLRAMHPGARRLPRDAAGRDDLYRETTSRKQALVVMDNAKDDAHVAPLLAPGGRTRVLITSRRLLSGLAGVQRVALAPLDPGDGSAWIRDAGIGDVGVAAQIAELCGQLPLALRIAANRLASRSVGSAQVLAARLRREDERIATLAAGHLRLDRSFTLSHQQLSDAGCQMLATLGNLPAEGFGSAQIAALSGCSMSATRIVLDELVELSLVEARAHGRFWVHDLVRLYAAGIRVDCSTKRREAGIAGSRKAS